MSVVVPTDHTAPHTQFGSIVYENVVFGNNVVVEEFCVIGVPSRQVPPDVETRIGAGGRIRSHTVIYAGNTIGINFVTGNKVNIRELNRIGDDVSIGTLSVVEHHVEIGNRVRIHTQAFIPEFSVLEDDCWVGPHVVFTNAKYPVSPGVKESLRGPRVRRGAKIGANATVLPGVVIGANALIGAGSVVVADVPDNAVVAGNPARLIKTIDQLPYGITL